MPTRPARLRAHRLLPFLLAPLLGAGACAEQVGDIDRTQVNRVRKSLFDGEWYLRQTTINVPYTAGFTFVGEQGETEKIRWEIQEFQLIAYRTYEKVDDSERPFRLDGDEYRGAPIAAYAIESHFDIQRQYNELTGEETNVIEENDVDRLWYEREFMRVDWSKNLVSNFNFMDNQVSQDPVNHYVQKPDDPDRFLVGVKGEDGAWTDYQEWGEISKLESADYIDVVERIFATPETLEFWWFDEVFEYPACWFYASSDCFASEIVIRSSFMKVDPENDYEPLFYPDNYVLRDDEGEAVRNEAGEVQRVPMFDKFGYFRIERERFDPRRGETESGRVYLANRWNLWKDSRHKNLGFGGTAEEPFLQVRPIGGRSHPEWREGYDVTVGAAGTSITLSRDGETLETFSASSGTALTSMVNARSELISLQLNRTASPPSSESTQSNIIPMAEREPKPIVYHLSPGFPEAYREAAQQVADGWSQAFGRTVEALTGRAPSEPMFQLAENSYAVDASGTVTDRGQRMGDLRFSFLYWVPEPQAAGPLGYGPSAIDPETGEIFSAFAGMYGAHIELFAQRGKDTIDLLNRRVDIEDFTAGEHVAEEVWPRNADAHPGITERPRHKTTLKDVTRLYETRVKTERVDAMKRQGKRVLKRRGDTHERLRRVAGTGIDALLMNEEVRKVRGVNDDRVGSQPMTPWNWASRKAMERDRDRRMRLARNTVYHMDFADDSVKALAFRLADTPSEDIFQELASRIFRSTAEHEVGHTVGLRHNFEGSTDAMNYHREYWDHRPANPAWLDDDSQEEWAEARKLHALPEFQYGSIMDYGAKFNSDIAGLGLYEHAAIAFGYGQLVETFDTAPQDPLLGHEVCQFIEGRNCNLDDLIRNFRHYTAIPDIVGGVDALYQRNLVPYETIVGAMREGTDPGVVEVPYRFCSDEYAGGTPTCNLYDEGADSWEIVEFAAQNWRNYYYFNNFRRDQRYLDVYGHYDNVYYRYFSFAQIQYQHWAWQEFIQSWLWGIAQEYQDEEGDLGIDGTAWTTAVNGGAAMTASVHTGLRFLSEVITAPEPGSYYWDPDEGEMVYWTRQQARICEPDEDSLVTDCADAYVPLGEGRLGTTEFDFDSGYYYFDRVKWVGSFWDKLAALTALADPETFFLGVDADADVDGFAINYNLMFPNEMSRLFGGMIADDFSSFAGVVTEGGGYIPRDVMADPAEYEGTLPLDPNTSFTVQLYALFYGMAFFPANFDQTFNDAIQVWVDGNGESFTPDPEIDPADIAEFRNPFNGKVYRAVRHGNQSLYSTGFEIVSRAAELAEAYEQNPDDADVRWEIQNIVENMELIRGMYQIYGSSWW